MNNNKPQKQVSLAGVAKSTAKNTSQKRKLRWGRVIAVVLVPVIIVVACLLMQGEDGGPALTAREMVEYTVTPDSISGKVSYFALGVTGEDATDCMDMVGVLCYDRGNKSASLVQIPVATYIGKDTGFAVSTVGQVWGNPQPETFCSTCRVRLTEEEITDGTHTTCGSATEQRNGSSYGDFIRVLNEQYGLPVDNYLVVSRTGLIEMIDLLGGVDVELEEGMKLADVDYKAGVQTLPGDAAVDYAITDDYNGTPKSDVARMERQRKVLAAVLQRLGSANLDDLYAIDPTTEAVSGVFGKLMLGENPVRFNTTSFGKARLLNVSENSVSDMKLSMAIAKFAQQIGGLSLDKVTVSVLPGETVKDGTATVYSVNRAKVIELLNGQMNPYGLTLDDTTVTTPQLKENPGETEIISVALDTVAVSQSEPSADTEGEE